MNVIPLPCISNPRAGRNRSRRREDTQSKLRSPISKSDRLYQRLDASVAAWFFEHLKRLDGFNGNPCRSRRALALALSCLLGVMPITLQGQLATDPFTQLVQARAEAVRGLVAAIETEIRSANPEELRGIEAKLLILIQAPEANAQAKSWACRTLRQVGSAQSVPVLAALLTDPQCTSDAQFALRSIPGAAVDQALREALPKTEGMLRVGVIQTLGARKDRQSVAWVAPFVNDADPKTVEAALYALGQMGGNSALQSVQQAKVPEKLKRYQQHAQLLIAESLSGDGDLPAAVSVYRTLFQQSEDTLIKAGALRGMLKINPGEAGPLLLAALKANDVRLRSAGAQALGEVADTKLLAAAFREFNSWFPDTQIIALGLINHPAGLPAVLPSTQSENEAVRVAALEALGRMGDASSLPVLLVEAAKPGRVGEAARNSLQSMRQQDVNSALLERVRNGSSEIRVEAIRALAGRKATTAVPVLLGALSDRDSSIRLAACHALGVLADADAVPELMRWLLAAKSEAEINAAEAALAEISLRASDQAVALAPLFANLTKASSPARGALLRVLAQVPSRKSLEAMRMAAQDEDAAVKNTAIRCLADWPDSEALEDLQRIASGSDLPVHRVLALRGFIRLAALPGQRPVEQTTALLETALGLASSPPEKKQVLAALGEMDQAAALALAVRCLADPAVEIEAANTVVRLARKLQKTDPDAAGAAIQKILEICQLPQARQVAESAGLILSGMVNIAPQGVATSPDGWEKDGEASGDQAAIDGDPATYWDEENGKPLYRLVVDFNKPESIAAVSITGWAQHNYAPKNFEILCDDQVVQEIGNAQYEDNFLVVAVPATPCQKVELKIQGYYGSSPAIRELGLYRATAKKAPEYRVMVYSKTLGFRHASIADGIRAIRDLGREHAFGVDATEDSRVFTQENLARYRAVVFLSVTGDVLNSDQEEAFKNYILNGGGFAAIHGALFGPAACEDKWAWYGELMCAAFKNHSAVVPAQVDVEDRDNPSTRDLPAQWSRTDEWYNFSANPRGCARVLATVDESSFTGGTMGADHPIAWCKSMGKGRMWYTAMGHTESSFAEPLFRQHLLGGIEQVAGVKPAEVAPNRQLQ